MSPSDPPCHEPDVQNQSLATTALDQSNKVLRFPYMPLKSSEFRLLHLTGLVNGQISGELVTADFPSTSIFSKTEPPVYTCLSYMWGSPFKADSSSHVLINAHPFKVPPNLMSFLECYVAEKLVITDDAAGDTYLWVDYKSMNAYLWIDQICIDQLNVPEKTAQVKRMDEIYLNAQGGTVVWLGDPRAASYLGTGLSTATWEKTRDLVDRMTALAESVRGSASAYHICKEHMSTEDMGILAQIVSDMVENPYWTRMWIVQEVLLSPIVMLLYGPHIFQSETIYAIGSFAYYRDSIMIPPNVYELWTDRQWFDGQEGMELARALKWVEGECFNVRDKVFAVLGTVKTDERALLQIDYAMPTEVLFADVVRAMIVTSIHEHDNEWDGILNYLGQNLGIPSALAPLGWEKKDGSNTRDFTYISTMMMGLEISEVEVDWRNLSLVELIQVIYEHAEPIAPWSSGDQHRKRVKEWLEMQEDADVEELNEDIRDMRRPTMARVETKDFVLVPGD